MNEIRIGYIFKIFTSILSVIVLVLSYFGFSFFIVVVLMIIEEILKYFAEARIFVGFFAFFTRMAEDDVGGTFVSTFKGLHIIAVAFPFTLGIILSRYLNLFIGVGIGYIYIITYFFLVIRKIIYL